MRLVLPYEVRPYVINQRWGVLHLDARGKNIYEQFGFKLHNGIDVAPGVRNEVRAPFDFEVQQILWQPNGGGHVVGIISQEKFLGPNGKECYVQIDFMHNASIKVPVGHSGKAGEVVCIAGNTGFSTGPHTHIRYKWMKKQGSRLVDAERNDAQNSFDPEPYQNGTFAADLEQKPKYFPFSTDLYIGMDHPEVKELQKFLNNHGYRVNWLLNGSPGHESTYFGRLTQSALARYQRANNIVPAHGYFGPLTRRHIAGLK